MSTALPSPDVDSARALEAMRLLAAPPELSQPELSHALGLSLRKMHYILQPLLDKGLVKIRNFRRNDNQLAYAYLLTPKKGQRRAAVDAKLPRSQRG